MKVFQRDRLIGQPVTTNENICDIMKLEFGIITTARQQHLQHLMTRSGRNSRLKVSCILFFSKVAMESLCTTDIHRQKIKPQHCWLPPTSSLLSHSILHFHSTFLFDKERHHFFSHLLSVLRPALGLLRLFSSFKEGPRLWVRKSQIVTRSQPVTGVRSPSVK